MGEEVVASAVDGLLRDDVPAVRGQGLNGIGDGGRAGGDGQGSGAALQSGQAFLQNVLGGVRQSAVDIAGVCEAEAVRRVLAVMENVRGGLIDRHRSGIGGRVGLLLPDVQL